MVAVTAQNRTQDLNASGVGESSTNAFDDRNGG